MGVRSGNYDFRSITSFSGTIQHISKILWAKIANQRALHKRQSLVSRTRQLQKFLRLCSTMQQAGGAPVAEIYVFVISK